MANETKSKEKFSWEKEIPLFDTLIREGRGGEASQRLKGIFLSRRDIPRAFLSVVANLCWRSGISEEGIRILYPIVRPEGKNVTNPTAEEISEYAACLIKIGVTEEGLLLLKSLDAEKTPSIYLYRAFGTVVRWDYKESIAMLEVYVKSEKISAYQRMVGKVNLAAAYVFEREDLKATVILRELLHDSSIQKKILVLGRVLELSAENHIHHKRWDEAEEALKKAEEILGGSRGIDLFLVRKCRALAHVWKANGDKKALVQLRNIRREALEIKHWETIRDCDRVEGTVAKDSKLLQAVYFGTPFQSFRQNLVKECSWHFEVPNFFDWHIGGGRKAEVTFDLLTARAVNGKKALKLGKQQHRLLVILSQDFYRPFSTATLFGKLYPDEYFNLVHSPVRVRQAVKRLREWFKESKIPLSVEEANGTYRLCGAQGVAIRIPLKQAKKLDKHEVRMQKLRAALSGKVFSINEASEVLEVCPRNALRILDIAIRDGEIEKTGKTSTTRYAFREEFAKAS